MHGATLSGPQPNPPRTGFPDEQTTAAARNESQAMIAAQRTHREVAHQTPQRRPAVGVRVTLQRAAGPYRRIARDLP